MRPIIFRPKVAKSWTQVTKSVPRDGYQMGEQLVEMQEKLNCPIRPRQVRVPNLTWIAKEIYRMERNTGLVHVVHKTKRNFTIYRTKKK